MIHLTFYKSFITHRGVINSILLNLFLISFHVFPNQPLHTLDRLHHDALIFRVLLIPQLFIISRTLPQLLNRPQKGLDQWQIASDQFVADPYFCVFSPILIFFYSNQLLF